jgi:3,5-epimerase/4-reductase
MILIYGGDGWIGKKIINILSDLKAEHFVSKNRADNISAIETEILTLQPENVLCLLGRTHGSFEGEYIHTIDYLEKKGKIQENVRDNLFCPIALALLCKKYNIHLTYLGTGCIFSYKDDKKIFTEDDTPNFFGSSYSVVKGFTDRLMHMFDNVLNVRIRMPISSDLSPRNFIIKLLNYKKICSMQNSMTVLDELLPIMCDMCLKKEVGTINLTNPGTIEHSEILDMYKEIFDPTFTYDLFSYEEQMKVIACDRSNNELDASKICSKYNILNIKESVRQTLTSMKIRCNCISYNVNGYHIGKSSVKSKLYEYIDSDDFCQSVRDNVDSKHIDWLCFIHSSFQLAKPVDMIANKNACLIMSLDRDNHIPSKNFILVNLKHHLTKEIFQNFKSIFDILLYVLSADKTATYINFIQNVHFLLRHDTKLLWREFACLNSKYLDLQPVPKLTNKSNVNAVLIEFRVLDNLYFVIRNCMSKLKDKVFYTVVCSNDNYEQICTINSMLNNSLSIIKLDLISPDVNLYNNLLLSKSFWEILKGEYVLVYQDDTCIFKDNIEDFLIYDYIGAPWPPSQEENKNNVGNGGFSLRNRRKMIDALNFSISDLKLSENCKGYIKDVGLQLPPEDVFFSTVLINRGDKVADFDTAKQFSQELVESQDPFGGHNWWLHHERKYDKPYDLENDFTKIFKCVAFASLYEYTLGGGEKYLAYFMKYFISMGYIVCFYTVSSFITATQTLSLYLTQPELNFIKLRNWNDLRQSLPNLKVDYFVLMSNSAVPCVKGVGKYNIFHCQFPFDMDKALLPKDIAFINSYDVCIVNSDFTYEHMASYYKGNVKLPIKIVYPPCLDTVNEEKFLKEENSFVMIGRIFEHGEMANNKYFDVAIEIFNKIKSPSCNLTILGSVKSQKHYEKLLGMIEDKSRIKIIPDAHETVKHEVLKRSKYYIQLTGMLDRHPRNQEHFGIAMIEAINYGCIPICFEGGYAKYIINKNNGFLVRDADELYNLITHMPGKKLEEINVLNYTYCKFKDELKLL